MLPIVCVVGASNSGKTTFLEKLIPELSGRGYRIGTVKHDAHGVEMDREGKDTWKHRKAGAGTIAISSPAQVATIRTVEGEMELAEVAARFFWSEDLVITEGFKRSHYPKIEIFRKAVEATPICGPQDNLLALVTDDAVQADVPSFRFEDVSGVADLIEERFLRNRRKHGIAMFFDGKNVPMNDFVRDFLSKAILGMLTSLKGWKKPKKIDIQIRLEDE